MNNIIIQIYGIRTLEDARMAVDLGANHIGVCYGRIKRVPNQLDPEEAKVIFDGVQPHAVKIGLTVAEDIEEIAEDLKIAMPDVLHLSGNIEGISPREAAMLKQRFPSLKIMQAIPVLRDRPITGQKVLDYVKEYESVSDFFLIDTKETGAPEIGATGLVHDWTIDRAIIESTSVPCIIAGGLSAENVTKAVEITRPYGADSFTHTNYDFIQENTKSIKDPAKIRAFVEAARCAEF